MLQAVLFDLDGTLLKIRDTDFMQGYFELISQAVAPIVEPKLFLKALMESAKAMVLDNTEKTNAQVFWQCFRAYLPDCHETLASRLDLFYANEYKGLSSLATPSLLGRQIVQTALDKGLRIVLATNPLFPGVALYERMAWANIDDLPWELITTYENMHYSKPHPEYYLEIADKLQVSPQDCLMVGNDVPNDIEAPSSLGMRTALTTDFLINPQQVDYCKLVDWHGTAQGLKEWLPTIY